MATNSTNRTRTRTRSLDHDVGDHWTLIWPIIHQNRPVIHSFSSFSNILHFRCPLWWLLMLALLLLTTNPSSTATSVTTTTTSSSTKNEWEQHHERDRSPEREHYESGGVLQSSLVVPLLRFEIESDSSFVELVLPLTVQTLPYDLIDSSTSFKLHLTANTLHRHDNTTKNLQFLSKNFLYTRQQPDVFDRNDVDDETLELRFTNHSEYYSNHLIEQFRNIFYTERMHHNGQHSFNIDDGHKKCQLFTADSQHAINYKNNNQTKITASATITICQDGTMNGFVTLDPYGHILLEDAQTADHDCHHHPVLEMLADHQTIQLHTTCPHRIQFIAFPQKPPPSAVQFSPDGTQSPQMTKTTSTDRRKRSYSSERTIEMLVVTDKSMTLFHGNSLRNYVFALMAMVSHLFKHSSIGNEINIKLVKLTSLMDDKQQKNWSGSAHKTLRHFCRWQYEHNHQSDQHPQHWDTAILLTKIDLCKNEINYNEIDSSRRTFKPKTRSSCDTLGLAHSGQICDQESSCAIVEDNGLSAAFTIAHELGHLLGVPHDDEEQCKKYYAQLDTPKRQEFNVMVRMIDTTSHMWSWSSCSKHFITEFLDSGHGDCLLDNNAVDVRQSSSSPESSRSYDTYQRRSFYATKNAGALYSADEQCRLVFDKNSSICLDMPYCKKLWCTSNNVGACRTHHLPWADGTECGTGFWCQEGECVRSDGSSRRPVNGGWGEWSPWSQCSLSCGGGIRRSKRECNNPSPKYGGKFCIGERVKYESCNLEPCPYQSSNDDARAKQCSEFDQYNMTWLPKYNGVPSSELCALYCESSTGESHKMKSRVVDGTPCSPDSFDICVNGKCLRAGCDRILGSNVSTDNCGVCGGDNSTCRVITGQFKPRSVSHGYTFILSIPPGSTNVDIVKKTSVLSDNWLALRGEYGNYLLNGHFTVNVYERKWYYGGTTVEYSGTKHNLVERINITRPIQKPLHLEVLCVGELHVPIIDYHFVVTSHNPYVSYKWISDSEWSQCNKACNGEQERMPYCVAVIRPSWLMDNSQPMVNEIRVKDEYCSMHSRPDTEYRVCNSHCELEWHIYQTSPCSTKCGHGFRTRHVNCTQTFINHSERIYIDDFYCAHLGAKPSDRENCTGDECRVSYQWQYTEWSPCTIHQQRTCGTGQQQRNVHCIQTTMIDSSSDVIHSNVAHELCQQHFNSEPVLMQTCQVECPTWKIEPWSECSVNCDQPERTRMVTCMHGDQHVNDAYCETLEPKPMERMQCDKPANCYHQNSIDTNFYHFENHNRQPHPTSHTNNVSKHHSQQQDVSYFIGEQDVIASDNNEILMHNRHHHNTQNNNNYLGTWQSGEWSSCDILYNLIRNFINQINYHAPTCFHTNEQMNQFNERFVHLFKLNESIHSKSYNDLAQLLNVDVQNLIRGRYVACVLPNSQHVLPDRDCDHRIRPKSEEKCPIEGRIYSLIPKNEAKLCSANLAKSIDSISYEIEPKTVNGVFDPFKSVNQEIKWKSGDWSSCVCDRKRKLFIRKRKVICVRYLDDGHGTTDAISDEYCIQNHLSKPNMIEECSHKQYSIEYNQLLECDSYAATSTEHHSRQYRTDSNDNFTTNMEQILSSSNRNRYQLYPSNHQSSSFQPSEQLITFTPTMSSSASSSMLLTTSNHHHHQQYHQSGSSSSLSSSLVPSPLEHDAILPTATVSLQTALHSSTNADHTSHHKASSSQASSKINYYGQQYQHNLISSSTEYPTLSNMTISATNQMTHHTAGWTDWTEWSECSVPCGIGVQSREPRCMLVNGHCDERVKPQPEYRSCHNICGFFKWNYSDWSPCSVSCGAGYRTRNVHCSDWTGSQVPNRFCEGDKPNSKEHCRMDDCKLVWRTGQWSECSQPCGPGLQTRTVTCHRINQFGVVDPQPLDHSNLIRRRRRRKRKHGHHQQHQFNMANYDNYHKLTAQQQFIKQRKFRRKNSNYDKNRAEQAMTSRRRNRQSSNHHEHYSQQPSWCNMDNRPIQTQTCNLGACLQSSTMADAYVWRTTNWQTCSTPCGSGYQRRKVYCYSQRTNNRVERSRCDPKLRPEKRRQCNLRSCEVISCKDRRDRAQGGSDGEYELWIQGAIIRVYCLGMSYMEKPIEYLILSENAYDDNYSELNVVSGDYYNSQCSHYSRKEYWNAGKKRIYFKHVRFDPLTMQIYANDTRFTVVQDSNTKTIVNESPSIGYGEAFFQGCPLSPMDHHHSTTNCYFGTSTDDETMFSINLQKTGLAIVNDGSNDVHEHWIMTGNDYYIININVRISRNDEKIIGRCSLNGDKLPITIPNTNQCLIGCQPIDHIIKVRIP